MRKVGAVLVLLLAGCPWREPAQASGDFGCYPEWTLAHPDYTGCDNMAMLQPGNDTRANLLLLMLDQRGDAPATAAAAPTPDPLSDWETFGARFQPASPAPAQDAAESNTDAESSYAEGEGSRCRSDAAGTQAFAAAVNSSGIPDAEKTLLTEARQKLAPTCTAASGGAEGVTQAVAQMHSPLGKSFAAYLQGAQAFYDGDFDAAAKQFDTLTGVDQPWLSETARYMLGRVEVNRAQVGLFDEYGSLEPGKTAGAEVTEAAEASLNAYIQAYPQGLYTGSARGLLRRVYWLGGRADKLAEAYASVLASKPEARGVDDVAYANEVDNKLLGFTMSSTGPAQSAAPALAKEPVLLAVFDLQQMRCAYTESEREHCGVPFERGWLEAQKPSFAASQELFGYLLALYDFYHAKNPSAVLQAIPETTPQSSFSTLEFSRQALRGMALEAVKDNGARDHWLAMLPGAQRPLQRGALELALALHDERAKALDRVFAADSPIGNVEIRRILLENVADAGLLRRRAADTTARSGEAQVALFTLLYKELSRGHYADFVKDVALVPADATAEGNPALPEWDDSLPPVGVFARSTELGEYECKPLKDTAARLAKNPKDSKAQLCLADFFRANGFDYETLDTQPEGDMLGGTPSLFKGPIYSRLDVYRALIVSAKTPQNDRAYALYRAVMCYAPSGNNSCGGKEADPPQRKAWFMQLKKNYPNTPWAKALQYYW
ncbi:MAG TPA: hypothetical protein VHA35_05415 [Dongiaceae bacterium]|nr:hypothetical protein [Dongiaceae bacterium]